MKPFDVVKYISSGFVTCLVSTMVCLFSFEQSEKTFAGRIVTAMTSSTH